MGQFNAKQLIEKLELMPHPEGGYFRETYRSPGTIGDSSLPESMVGYRNYSTAIYFLLGRTDYSRFHTLKADEIWHFHAGFPLEIIEITPSGQVQRTILGLDLDQGHVPQYVIRAGNWFGARCLDKNLDDDFCFLSCTVSPGFDFQDFELASSDFAEKYPQAADYPELLVKN